MERETVTKKQILEKLKAAYDGHIEIEEEEKKRGNPFASYKAYGYLQKAVEIILKEEGIEIQS